MKMPSRLLGQEKLKQDKLDREIPFVTDPPRANLTPLQNLAICPNSLYIIITF